MATGSKTPSTVRRKGVQGFQARERLLCHIKDAPAADIPPLNTSDRHLLVTYHSKHGNLEYAPLKHRNMVLEGKALPAYDKRIHLNGTELALAYAPPHECLLVKGHGDIQFYVAMLFTVPLSSSGQGGHGNCIIHQGNV